MIAELQRLIDNDKKQVPIETWGPYVSDRQWGTVREDYSPGGNAWSYFPFDHAISRTYRWGEDGIAAICDIYQNLCFGLALWNGQDPIIKERLFGLANNQGNHGEDVKELYYYLDNTPTHYYMQMLYKYPQQAFPYQQIIDENKKRGKLDPEYEILDTGIFNENKYFDVTVTYAKYDKNDIAIRIDILNRGAKAAPLTVLPTLWYYNKWQYGSIGKRPSIIEEAKNKVRCSHERLGTYYLYFDDTDERLFTENETNMEKLFKRPNTVPFTKDAFNDALIHQTDFADLRKKKIGTKFSPVYYLKLKPGQKKSINLRLCQNEVQDPFANVSKIFNKRKKEADEFYATVLPKNVSDDGKAIQRQAYAGLLWSKQYYHYDVERWISTGDGITPPTEERKEGRNHNWPHLKNQDIISMPDKWEYPWYAAWDLAFHCISMAVVDVSFAKHQLILLGREWYMNPEGQLPAYEWNFSDVNPPVHAWAALQVYQIEKRKTGKGDIGFLKRIFQKLLINFTWWVNRKDPNGNNIFEGGFLGLDNIGVFNRSIRFPEDTELEQADGTSWMGMYALNLMDIAMEIAVHDISFEDTATKFFEHFIFIAEALNELGLWNNEDKFYYDVLMSPQSKPIQLQIQSIVGLTSLFAVSIIEKSVLQKLPDFTKRITWFENYRKSNNKFWPNEEKKESEQILLSLIPKERLIALLQRMLNESEFLSDGGIRALSKYYKDHPYSITIDEKTYTIEYDPGDSTSDFFGGNSNWRGPVWMPINYLIIQSIKKYGKFYNDALIVEYPTGSGKFLQLGEVADELAKRLISLFTLNEQNQRKLHGNYNWFYSKEENKNLILFYEYFHGDTGRGLGASHQTGWTAMVSELISEIAEESIPSNIADHADA